MGVVAMEKIKEGTVIARIPRKVLLTASHSVVAMAMKDDATLMSSFNNSWVPLLIALVGEYAQQVNNHNL